MTYKLLFKAQTLAPVITDVKNNGGELWFMVDEGIYLTAEKASFVRGKRNISYAQGFDPYESNDVETFFNNIDRVVGDEDVWMIVNLPPETQAHLATARIDLAVEVTDSGYTFSPVFNKES